MAKPGKLKGERFGRLLVLRESEDRKRGYVIWVCRCDCGGTKLATTEVLRSSRTRSCGCLQDEARRANGRLLALPHGVAAFNALYDSYKRNAAYRGHSFDLTRDQARQLFLSECHYCGTGPSNIFQTKSTSSPFMFNGIDRIHPRNGYSVRNCVAACKICNRMKASMDYGAFMATISRIADRHCRAAVLGHNNLRTVMKYVHVRQQDIDAGMVMLDAERKPERKEIVQ